MFSDPLPLQDNHLISVSQIHWPFRILPVWIGLVQAGQSTVIFDILHPLETPGFLASLQHLSSSHQHDCMKVSVFLITQLLTVGTHTYMYPHTLTHSVFRGQTLFGQRQYKQISQEGKGDTPVSHNLQGHPFNMELVQYIIMQSSVSSFLYIPFTSPPLSFLPRIRNGPLLNKIL